MALKSLIMEYVVNLSSYLSLSTYLLLLLSLKILILFSPPTFLFQFQTLPEPYKPLQDTKTHGMPRIVFYASSSSYFVLRILIFQFLFRLRRNFSTSHSSVTMKATTMKLRGCIFCASASSTFINVILKIQIIVFGSSP